MRLHIISLPKSRKSYMMKQTKKLDYNLPYPNMQKKEGASMHKAKKT